MTYIIAQGFGIIGMLLAIFSFQCRSNKKFFSMQAMSGLMFSLNYLLIGTFTGALLNFFNIVRGYVFSDKNRCGVKKWLVLICTLYSLSTLVTQILFYDGVLQLVLALLITAAMLLTSYAMWTNKAQFIRKMQIFVSSPFWLIHNIINFTLGGIFCEVFNIASVIIYFIRFRYEKAEKQK